MILDTELANKKIAELEALIESLNISHAEEMGRQEQKLKDFVESARQIQQIDHDENEMLTKENEELRQQIEALQTELDQLKTP